jgi:glycosyltransferase involved in cell wall biosynthesis
MRIGMMADYYKPQISGVTNYIALNKKQLEAMGHEVFVFTIGDDNYEDDEDNIIRSPGLPIRDTGYYFNLRYKPSARALLRTMDVVHVHHPFLSGNLALNYCRRRGIPVVFTNHTRYDLYSKAYLPKLPDVISETALKAFLPSFCKSCDLVISPSPGMRDVLQHLGVEANVEVIPNGVDIKPFEKPDPLDRGEFGYDPEHVVLVYTGRLGPEKNLVFLLRAFAGTYQAYDHARLMLIGDGPEMDNLQDRVRHMRIQEVVKFVGFTPYDQVPGYLAMANGFTTASVTETFGLSIVEAMAVGLPVLGISSPGVGDIVQDGETGFIIHKEDLAAYTAMMVRLVVDKDWRERMGDNARQVAKIYAIENTCQLLLDKYQEVVIKRKNSKNGLRVRLARKLDRFRK